MVCLPMEEKDVFASYFQSSVLNVLRKTGSNYKCIQTHATGMNKASTMALEGDGATVTP